MLDVAEAKAEWATFAEQLHLRQASLVRPLVERSRPNAEHRGGFVDVK